MKKILILFPFLFFCLISRAQEKQLALEEVIELAKENNFGLKAQEFNKQMHEQLIKSAFSFAPTEIYNAFDQNDLALNGLPNYKVGIAQSFEFPSIYGARKELNTNYLEMAEEQYKFSLNHLSEALTTAFFTIQV